MAELLVDLGNSQAKLAWLSDDRTHYLGACGLNEECAPLLPERPSRIWLSNVAAAEREKAFLDRLGLAGVSLTRVTVTAYRHHQPSRYAPDQLGVDRWLAALACRERGLTPAVIVDVGTATTVDFLDAQGTHLGGYILPGPDLMRRALFDHTALRPRQRSPHCDSRPPVTTADAIACGALQAQLGAIERALFAAGKGASLVLSGGGAGTVSTLLAHEVLCVEQLVLEGLAVLARRERLCAG